MKKIVFEIIQIIIIYICSTIYGYYNDPSPPNKYSWLESALMIIIIYPIAKLCYKEEKSKKEKKKKKTFNINY